MNLISASAIERVDACAPSAALPRVYRDTDAGQRGDDIHAFLCRLGQGTARDTALASVPEAHRGVCAELPDPGRGECEVAFAYDVVSGKARILGSDIDRQYGKLPPTEIPGTADHISMSGDVLTVMDYKTGHGEVTPARENLQLHFLALCATKAYGASKARVVLRFIHDDGGTHDDSHDLDAFDLADTAARLRKIYDRVKYAQRDIEQGKTPPLHEGAHCKYCPAKSGCPAKIGWLVRLTAPDAVKQKFGALLTGETAAQAYEVWKRIDDVKKDLDAQLYAWARENPIDLGNGRVFGLTTSEREYLDGQTVFRVLSELHGASVANEAVELSATKTSLEKALKTVAPRGALAGFKREALKRIGDADGIQVKVTETIKEHTRETSDGDTKAA